MTVEEYKKQIAAEIERHDSIMASIESKYALENNPVKIGDIVTDHFHTIKVEKISVYKYGYNLPECVYSGTQYTAKGEPCKRQRDIPVYQRNIKKINGKEYKKEG